MELGISGKSALVLGGGGGLGQSAALSLAAEGVKVCVMSRTIESATHTSSMIGNLGGHSLPVACDLADVSLATATIESLATDWKFDIIVNITGGPPVGSVLSHEVSAWRHHFDAMITSVIACTNVVVPNMVSRGWGRVITSTSSGVVAPISGLGISNTLRPALVGWSKSLSQEIAEFGVTSNIVIPGRFATKRVAELDQARSVQQKRDVSEVMADSIRLIPSGRYGEPNEFGAVVTFLASQPASYITGSMVRVDGGMIPSV